MHRFFISIRHALRGLEHTVKTQVNFRIHLILAVIAGTSSIYFQLSALEWCIVLVCIALVMSLELLNTAMEEYTDHVTPQYNQQAGKIKDIAASAVLVASFFSLVVACVIFLPKIWTLVLSTIHGH